MRFLFSFLFLASFFSTVNAETVRLSFAELREAAGDGSSGQVLEDLGLDYAIDQRNVSLEGGCAYSSVLDWLQGSLQPTDDGYIEIGFDTLGQPLQIELHLPLVLVLNGHVEQEFGVSAFGRCTKYAEDGFNLSVNGAGKVTVRISVDPQLEAVGDALVFTPQWTVNTTVDELEYQVNVKGSLLESELEDRLRDQINAAINPEALAESAYRIEQALLDQLAAGSDDSFEFELTGVSERQTGLLAEYLRDEFKLPFNQDIVRQFVLQLVDNSATDEAETYGSLFESALICEMVRSTSLAPNTTSLYRQDENGCAAVDTAGMSSSGDYFSDAECKKSVAFSPTDLQSFCANTLNDKRVGDGSLLAGAEQAWTLSPGVSVDIGLASTQGKRQPYSTSRVYKEIQNDAGVCKLEMRVYKENPGDSNLIPLIALHGGSWQYRSNGILGIEALAAHYTSQGFAVFAPFYRLASAASGPVACQDATANDIVADVDFAMDWVQAHAEEFGLGDSKIRVTGQSAGAHLATWLAVNRASEIERALLLYPPTDMGDYLKQWLQGDLGTDPRGLSVVTQFLNVEREAIDLFAPVVVSNSFPEIIARSPDAYPPMFIIQGGADQLVPVRQSQRLCNGLSEDLESGPAASIEADSAISKRQVFACDDRDSQLHIITEADHTLDVCLFSVLCPAGDEESQSLARESLQEGYQWLRRSNPRVDSSSFENLALGDEGVELSASGGGGLGFFALLFLFLAVPVRFKFN